MTHRAIYTALALAVVASGAITLEPATAEARRGIVQRIKQGVAARRARTATRVWANKIRTGISTHHGLVRRGALVKMPQSDILTNKVAAQKKYSDSWTCRESSRLLGKTMAACKVQMTVESSGKKAFKWGKEGWVDYHYYLVDSAAKPTILLDPTGSSNFAKDARQGGLMRGLLAEAGQARGAPKAAARLADRIQRGGIGGLLVIANPTEIGIYKDALDKAARLKAEVTRNAETTPGR